MKTKTKTADATPSHNACWLLLAQQSRVDHIGGHLGAAGCVGEGHSAQPSHKLPDGAMVNCARRSPRRVSRCVCSGVSASMAVLIAEAYRDGCAGRVGIAPTFVIGGLSGNSVTGHRLPIASSSAYMPTP
jgi:hypothetical protein